MKRITTVALRFIAVLALFVLGAPITFAQPATGTASDASSEASTRTDAGRPQRNGTGTGSVSVPSDAGDVDTSAAAVAVVTHVPGQPTGDGGGGPVSGPAADLKQLQDQRKASIKVICPAQCASEHTLCIDAGILASEPEAGKPLCPKAVPNEIGAGSMLTVLVFGPESAKDLVEISTSTVRAIDRLTKDAGKVEGADTEYKLLKQLDVIASDDVAVQGIRVDFKRKDGGSSEFTIPINHGRYFLDVGILLALVPNGDRTVGSAPVSGTSDRQIIIREDFAVRPAVMLNAYLFGGHRRAGLCAFCNVRTNFGGVTGQTLRDVLGDLLAIQGGFDLDLSHLGDRMFFGGVIEPVSGLSFDMGVALVKGQFLPPSYGVGMLLDPAFQPETRLVPRFYFGFTLSLEIINFVAKLGRDIRGVKFQ